MLRLYSGTTLSNHTKRRLSAKLYLKLFYFYLYNRFQRQNTWDISVLFHLSSPPIIYQRKKLSRTFGCILLSWISKIFNNNPHSHRFPPSFPSALTMTIKNFPDVANTDPFHPTTGAGTSRPSPLPVGSACLFVWLYWAVFHSFPSYVEDLGEDRCRLTRR